MVPYPLALPLPALFPPGDGAHHQWPAPNYVNPETRSWAAPACVILLFVITVVTFVARIWARFRRTRTSGVDDWLIVATMLPLAGLTVATVLALRVYGFHLHIYDQTPKTYITVRQITLAIETIYLASTTLTKLSILLFFRRITNAVVSRPLLIAVWASIIFVAAYGITFIIVLIFTCSPVEAYWFRFSVPWLKTHKYTCTDEVATLMVIIVLSTVQDFIACLLPMFVVLKLRLPFRQKIALAGVFLVGLSVCALGALRVHYAHRVYYYTKLNPSATYDITWEALGSWVATAVEANVAVWCACAPALKTYFNAWLNKSDQDQRTFHWYGRISRGWWQPRLPGELPDSGCQMGLVDMPVSNGSTTVVSGNRQLTHISSHTVTGSQISTKTGVATEMIERRGSGGSALLRPSPCHRNPLG